MSLQIVRKALEKHLAAMTPALPTAYENDGYAPVVGTPYQRVNLLPAEPDNSIAGAATYFERGIFQITLCYPLGKGPGAAEARAQLVRAWFKRGTSLVQDGITVNVMATPKQAPALPGDDVYGIPVSVTYQAQIAT